MNSKSVVVLTKADTGTNEPNEFIIAVVDRGGNLRQYHGADCEIAEELLSICDTGWSLTLQREEKEFAERRVTARERGDTPEMAVQPDYAVEFAKAEEAKRKLQFPPGVQAPAPILAPAMRILPRETTE